MRAICEENVSRTGRCGRAAPLRRGLRSGPGAPRAVLWRAAAGKRVGHGRVDEGRCGADRRVPAGNHGARCSKGLPPCRRYILVCLRNSQAKQRAPGSKGLPPCRLGRRQRRVMYRYRQTAAVKGREHSGIGWIRAGLDRARDSDAKTAELK